MILTQNGTVYAMGDNTYGQIQTSDIKSYNLPTIYKENGDVVGIAVGARHTIILGANGTVGARGENVADINASAHNNVDKIAAGGYHTLLLLHGGTVHAYGKNQYGQLGIGNTAYKYIPIKVEKDKSGNKMPAIEKIVCIDNKIYFIATNGDKYLNGVKNTDAIDMTLDTITILPNLKKEQLE